jgi:hypothetical protein
VVLDGGSSRLEHAQRFRQQVLQEHPFPSRPLEPAHLLIRCPRASSPPPRSRPWQIGSSTARFLLPSASGSPALPWPVVASRSSQTHRLLPAPASTASFFGMPCASPSGAPLAAPALGWLPRLLPVSGRIVGCRGAGRRVASTSSLCERMYYYCCVVVAGLWRRSTPFQKLRQTQRQRLLPVPVAAGLISSPGSRCSPAL